MAPTSSRIARNRSGFTLVELLVAVGIFLILATLAFGAFSAASEGDRGPAAARSLSAWIEGARSRAAELGRPVGIQPIISTDVLNGHAVRQFQYVANVEPIQGTLSTSAVSSFQDIPSPEPGTLPPNRFTQRGAITDGLFHDVQSGLWLVTQDTTASSPLWSAIDGLNPDGSVNDLEPRLIKPGQRIEIPAGSRNWYTISAYDPRTAGMGTNPRTFNPSHDGGAGTLDGFYIIGSPSSAVFTTRQTGTASGGPPNRPPAALSPSSAYVSTFFSGLAPADFTYRLELGPDILEGEKLLSLPGGMVMDLDASITPPNALAASTTAPYDNFTLMFSPTGEVIGDYAGVGRISFYLDTQQAVELYAGTTDNPETPWNETTHLRVSATWPLPDGPPNGLQRIIPTVSIGQPQVLTVFPKTGFTQKSVVDPTDTVTVDNDGNVTSTTAGDGWADNPYSLTLRGDLDR